MQKTFIKYTSIIMMVGILLILSFNSAFMFDNLEKEQYESFCGKIEQVIHTLKNNQMELDIINENLDMDYLTRARAAVYMIDHYSTVMEISWMQELARFLDVDELHIIDENGIIISGSVPEYIGFDMTGHPQSSPFLELLDREKGAYLIQEQQPNAAEGKIMKYVGVRRDKAVGIVQVGFEPTRQLEAKERNSYKYIFSRFPVGTGEELFVADVATGEILGHSVRESAEFSREYCEISELLNCEKGEYIQSENGKMMYVVSRRYEDVLICTALPRKVLFHELWINASLTFLYLLFVDGVVIFSLNSLVKHKVIDGIHGIIGNLSAITKGELDIRVKQGGNREFEELSNGINAMVDSIISSSDRISRIIEISGVLLAAFEYEKGTKHLFVTSGLQELLGIPQGDAKAICADSLLFEKYIRKIMENAVEGETEIYEIGSGRYIRIHLSQSEDKYLGVITDVTNYMEEKRQMQYENTHDPLTGLYRYPYFKQLAQKKLEELSEGKFCAAVMLDLDYFKQINDTFGHDGGDKYLQRFAEVLLSLPEEHILTARRSGDEFCMMIYDCREKAEIVQYLDLFYGTLAKNPVVFEQETRVIGASCGFVCTGEPGEISALIAHADEALYEVKRETKGVYREYEGKESEE